MDPMGWKISMKSAFTSFERAIAIYLNEQLYTWIYKKNQDESHVCECITSLILWNIFIPAILRVCDLFGIVKTWPLELKGCWWPPTVGDKRSRLESPGINYIHPYTKKNVYINIYIIYTAYTLQENESISQTRKPTNHQLKSACKRPWIFLSSNFQP